MGRFLTADPLMATPQRLLDPQEWNLYAYARGNPLSFTDPTGLDIWLEGCGADSSTCRDNYVGTTDRNGHFTRLHLSGDQRGRAALGLNGVTVWWGHKAYQGVWDKNPGEQAAVTVTAVGDLSGFDARIDGSCHHTCVASGEILNLGGGPAQAGDVRDALTGKGDWFPNSADIFHMHNGKIDTSFNAEPPGPIHQRSTDVTVPQDRSLDVLFHVNAGFPFEDSYELSRHVGSIMHTFANYAGVLIGSPMPN